MCLNDNVLEVGFKQLKQITSRHWHMLNAGIERSMQADWTKFYSLLI